MALSVFGFLAEILWGPRRRKKSLSPSLERLEDRLVPVSMTVDSFADTNTGTYNANTQTGTGTLRYCINTVNNFGAGSSNTIVFNHGAGPPPAGTITLTSALPTISQDVTITGAGPSKDTINGGATSSSMRSVFTIGAARSVGIRGFKITDGWGNGAGGGISNRGTLALTSDSVTGNWANGKGGGIYVGAGAVTLGNSVVVSNNKAFNASIRGNGGGIYVANGASLICAEGTSGVEVENNTAANNGGGIYNIGTVKLQAGDIDYNSAVNGGGIYSGGGLYQTGAKVIVNHVTIDGNTATGNGGGICIGSQLTSGGKLNAGTSGSVFIESNSANQGGGIYVTSSATTVLANVIVQGNQLTGKNPQAAGVGYVSGGNTPTTEAGFSDSNDPGGKPVAIT